MQEIAKEFSLDQAGELTAFFLPVNEKTVLNSRPVYIN